MKNRYRAVRHLLAAVLTINLALWGAGLGTRVWVLPILLQAREAQLREDLRMMRKMIDQFTADNERAPQSLEELVRAGYLPLIPVDPMTGSADTWEVITEEE